MKIIKLERYIKFNSYAVILLSFSIFIWEGWAFFYALPAFKRVMGKLSPEMLSHTVDRCSKSLLVVIFALAVALCVIAIQNLRLFFLRAKDARQD